jgi:hypothetical protein
MKRPSFKRIGIFGLAVTVMMLANVLIASANPLNATLSVDRSGRVNRIGQATVGGTVTCDIPGSTMQFSGQLTQLSGRAQMSGNFYVNATCGPTPTPWSVTLRADNGIYTGGTAKVTINYGYACGYNGYYYECTNVPGLPATTSIKLKGGG